MQIKKEFPFKGRHSFLLFTERFRVYVHKSLSCVTTVSWVILLKRFLIKGFYSESEIADRFKCQSCAWENSPMMENAFLKFSKAFTCF